VSTGWVYGSAALWYINLEERTSRAVFKQEDAEACSVETESVDPPQREVHVRLFDCKQERRVVVPY
jgi:hypothetical protein